MVFLWNWITFKLLPRVDYYYFIFLIRFSKKDLVATTKVNQTHPIHRTKHLCQRLIIFNNISDTINNILTCYLGIQQ